MIQYWTLLNTRTGKHIRKTFSTQTEAHDHRLRYYAGKPYKVVPR